jgi:hypothetical protein
MCCIVWHKLRGGSSTAQTLGINFLLLTTNNTGVDITSHVWSSWQHSSVVQCWDMCREHVSMSSWQ